MPASATTSTIRPEIRLFLKKKRFSAVCLFSEGHHLTLGSNNDLSPEASHIKLYHVKLLVFAQFDICKC